MEIEILAEDPQVTIALAETAFDEIPTAVIGKPHRIPGFGESMHQLLCDLGVVALPVSVLGNIIAAWLLKALVTAPARSKARIILRNGSREAEMEIDTTRTGELKQAIQALVDRVY